MPKRVQLPDGTTGEFPDTMSDDDIGRVLRKQFPPPLREGVKVAGKNAAGKDIYAPTDTSAWDVFKQDIQDPEAWKNAGAAAWGELKAVPQGVASLFAPPESTGGKTALALAGPAGIAALAAKRLVKSELQSRGKLTSQAAGQFKAGHPVLGSASTFLAGLPIPGVPAMAAGINDSMDSGDVSGGIGKGLADVGMLAVPEAAVKGARALPAILRPTVQRLVGAGELPVKVEVAKAAEAADEARTKTLADNRSADENTLKDRGKVDATNSDALVKHQADVKAVRADNVKNLQDHLAAVDEAVKDKTAGPAILDAREGLQSAVDDATKDVDVRIEKARHDALEEGNKKYSGVNETLNPIQADPEVIQEARLRATEAIKGTSEEPKILKDMQRKADNMEVPTYEDLQGYYSELGREISKGSLPGDLYHAYDTLHEAIGDEMQRIADQNGQGAQLKSAREYWRRMKRTFGDTSDTVSDRAGKEVKEANPDAAKGQVSEYRRRLLGSFDPKIPQLLDAVDKGTQRLKDLPTEAKGRELAATKVPEPPAMKPQPKAPEPASYSEPHATKPIEIPGIDTRAIREKLFDRWISGEEKLDKYQVKRLLSGGLGAVAGQLLGGRTGAELGFGAGAIFGPTVIVKFLDHPAFREWITRPPADELATLKKLPNADRIKITDGLKQVVGEAQKRGIKVSPSLLTAIGYSGRPTPPALKGSPVDDQ